MKHNNTYFMQVTRSIWDYEISDKAKLLFFWLNELEQRYTGKNEEYFYRTDQELASDLGWSLKTLKKAKAELRKTDLIRFSRVHFELPNGKLSTKWMTGYQILK